LFRSSTRPSGIEAKPWLNPAVTKAVVDVPRNDWSAALRENWDDALLFRHIATVVTDLDVELVVTLGALQVDIPHTRPVPVTGNISIGAAPLIQTPQCFFKQRQIITITVHKITPDLPVIPYRILMVTPAESSCLNCRRREKSSS
jgi:hypothetical protein